MVSGERLQTGKADLAEAVNATVEADRAPDEDD